MSIFFTMWFWIDFVFFCLLTTSVVNEKPVLGLLTMIGFLLCTHFLMGFDIIDFIKNNTNNIIIAGLLYFPIGIAWAYSRWFMKVKNRVNELLEKKKAFFDRVLENARRDFVKRESKLNPVGTSLDREDEFYELAQAEWNKHVEYQTLKANSFKESIVNWIVWWPFSMFLALIDDGFTWCYKNIYNLIGKSFQKISDSQFKNIR